MNKSIVIILFFVIIGSFVFITNTIIDIYMFQLRMRIDREQVHNYELSSRMLRNRFSNLKGTKENYVDEIRMSVLESGIMNETIDKDYFAPDFSELVGYYVANSVRFIVFRPFLRIDEDRKLLFLMQYAFFMERQKRYGVASKNYKELEAILTSKKDTDRAFVLLHNAYCLALTGENDGAIIRLDEVIQLFPGTHFYDTALILRALILESGVRSNEILKNVKDPSDRIKQYFEEGLYKSVISETADIDPEDFQKQYYKGRSYEETGEVLSAVDIYVDIITRDKGTHYAKKANRRLMIIGSFYGGGEKIKEYATTNAAEFKEDQFINEVKKAEDLKLSSSVISKIDEKSGGSSPDDDRISEVFKEYGVNNFEEKKQISLIIDKVNPDAVIEDKAHEKDKIKTEDKTADVKSDIITKPPEVVLPYLRVYLKDGRSIRGESVKVTDKKVLVKNGSFFITLELLDIIRITGTNKNEIKFIYQDSEGTHSIITKELTLDKDEPIFKGSGKKFHRDSLVSGTALLK